ncbi:hypothetical protein LMTR13_30465 [Bradyrhizobium icense]|uniref:Uncharacterized protein n=1 Tax=Bradyrhizobium icense TaxID=1274631 RepID=A0A1B1UM80_9BRAD|nr:hypothetical protein LMTR13_30465 [Bradyrhizobium icense]
MAYFQSKVRRSQAAILRLKRDDSINPIIRKSRQICQHLRAHSALRKAGCGFYAANFAPFD